MDVLVLPSRTEGFGIAILEALTNGVVPIVLDIPIGIPDQIISGYNGFIVKENNWKNEAEQHLINLFIDHKLLKTMKINGMDNIMKINCFSAVPSIDESDDE